MKTPVPEEDQVIDSKEDKELDNGKYDGRMLHYESTDRDEFEKPSCCSRKT